MLLLDRRPSSNTSAYAQVLSPSDYVGTIPGTSMVIQDDRWNMPTIIKETSTRSKEEKILMALVLKLKEQIKTLSEIFEENRISESHIIDKFSITVAHLLAYNGQNIDVSLNDELSINFKCKISNTTVYAEYFLVYDLDDPEDEEIIITLDTKDKEIISFGGEFKKTWAAIMAESL